MWKDLDQHKTLWPCIVAGKALAQTVLSAINAVSGFMEGVAV